MKCAKLPRCSSILGIGYGLDLGVYLAAYRRIVFQRSVATVGSKRKKKSKRVTLVGESRVSPTPETLKKLKPDPLWKLAPELGSERLHAAHDIREAVRLISAPLRMRVQQWERLDRGYGDHESARAVHVQNRYNAWVDGMSDQMVPVGPALDLIIEGMGVRQIEAAKKWRHGAFRPYFIEAMDLYCDLAGWRR